MGPINTVQIQIQYLKIIYFQFFFNFVLMGKSDQHKKLVETSGEITLDVLIGADPEGGTLKRDTQIPLIPCKRRESVFTWIYIGSKKKTLISIFPPNWAILRHFCFFTKKKKNWSDLTLKKNSKNFPFHSQVRLGGAYSNTVQIKIQ